MHARVRMHVHESARVCMQECARAKCSNDGKEGYLRGLHMCQRYLKM